MKRKCPNCSNKINYKTEKSLTKANKLNSCCIKCAALKKVKSLSKDTCYDFAKLCSGKYDFMKKYRVPYNNALKNDWLEEFYPNKKELKWNKENSKEIALLYKSKKEFEKKNHYVYKMACRNKWIDDICQHMEVKRNKYGKKDCQEIALLYNSKKEFRKNNNYLYRISCKNKWIDEICSHMEILGNIKIRMIYSYVFPDNYVYVGLTYNIDIRNSQHMSNEGKQTAVKKHIIKTGLTPALIKHTNYITIDEAKLKENEILNVYKNKGYLILNTAKTGGLGRCIKHDKEKCKQMALLCKTVKEFKIKYTKEYNAARNNKWFPEIGNHLLRFKR